MAYMDVISPENRDISTWTKNMISFPVFENSCENGVNILDYQGGGGHERLYLPVTVKANTDYIFSVDFSSPTGFTCGGYDGVYEEYIAVTYNNPGNTNGLKSLALLGLSEPLLQEASETPSTYTVSFNSGRYTTVYLVINFGYITDFVTIRMIYGNIKLKTYTPWIMSGGYPTNTEFADMPESYMSKPYPKALWRIDKLINDGIPYHLLMPGITSVNLWQQTAKPLIHVYDSRSTATDFDRNGYAVIEPISCQIRQEKNGLYEAEMTAPVDEKSQYLTGNAVLKIPIKYHGKFTRQLFRMYLPKRTMDASGSLRISCNASHIFYDLNHCLVRNRTVTGSGNDAIQQIMDTSYGSSGAFHGRSDIATPTSAEYGNISVTAALLGDSSAFVNLWGGCIYRDNFHFSINKITENSKSTGVIRYAGNMTEIEFSADYSECVTFLIAVDNFGNSIELVNKNVPCQEFPHHIYRVVNFSYSTENPTRFQADAQAYFDNYKQPNVNIKVTFANLPDTDEYAGFLGLSDYEVGDNVIVYHADLGINYANLEIISKVYDAVNHETVSIEIGTFKNAVSRSGFMSGTVSGGSQTAEQKQLEALQNQLDAVAFDTYITTPITTIDGEYLTTIDGEYLLYKE